MKKRTKYSPYYLLLLFLVAATSCNDYLNEMPDNRAEIDSEEKVSNLLVSAYPENAFIMATELASDNVDDYSSTNPYYDRFLEQLY